MGRYYSGDIEGKFWFGVQPSDDGEFFGAVASEPSTIDYLVEDIEEVKRGLNKCLSVLGDNKKYLDEFFNNHNGYNDEMIEAWFKEKYNAKFDKEMLGWYARLELGEQIYECMQKKGYCDFQAEI